MQIKIKYSEGMEEIVQAHEGEWYDLRCGKDITMWAGDFAMISLGVAIELPEGNYRNPRTKRICKTLQAEAHSFWICPRCLENLNALTGLEIEASLPEIGEK